MILYGTFDVSAKITYSKMAFFSRTPVFQRAAIFIGEMSLELVLAAPLMLALTTVSTTASALYQQLARRRGAAAHGNASQRFLEATELEELRAGVDMVLCKVGCMHSFSRSIA